MAEFSFRIVKKDKKTRARAGKISTRRGQIETPYLVPVATSATVRSLDGKDLEDLGAQCALVNTYHLHLRPGDALIKKLGGVHKFMDFDKPIFSDSGGFQAFSLGFGKEHNINKIGTIFPGNKRHPEKNESLAAITDKGVTFRSIYDGSSHFIGPKQAMKIQSNLRTDIIMAFDECTSPLHDYEYTKMAMQRTHRWAKECLKTYDKKQAIYGIIQGGWWRDLRDESAGFITSLPFDGIAIGGALGKDKKGIMDVLEWVMPQLDGRPVHLLGIGEVEDLFTCIALGVDTFDCVVPTRTARRGGLFISPAAGGTIANKFRMNIKAGKHKDNKAPIDKYCSCQTCKRHSVAYLRHLYILNELAYYRLATLHNLHFVLTLVAEIRRSILNGTFAKLSKKWLG